MLSSHKNLRNHPLLIILCGSSVKTSPNQTPTKRSKDLKRYLETFGWWWGSRFRADPRSNIVHFRLTLPNHHGRRRPVIFSHKMFLLHNASPTIPHSEIHNFSFTSSHPQFLIRNSSSELVIRKFLIQNSSFASPHSQLLIHNYSPTTPHPKLVIHNSTCTNCHQQLLIANVTH